MDIYFDRYSKTLMWWIGRNLWHWTWSARTITNKVLHG